MNNCEKQILPIFVIGGENGEKKEGTNTDPVLDKCNSARTIGAYLILTCIECTLFCMKCTVFFNILEFQPHDIFFSFAQNIKAGFLSQPNAVPTLIIQSCAKFNSLDVIWKSLDAKPNYPQFYLYLCKELPKTGPIIAKPNCIQFYIKTLVKKSIFFLS